MKRLLFPSRAAFTLLEIMIVVVIIVLLLGFAISKMGGTLDVAKEAVFGAIFNRSGRS